MLHISERFSNLNSLWSQGGSDFERVHCNSYQTLHCSAKKCIFSLFTKPNIFGWDKSHNMLLDKVYGSNNRSRDCIRSQLINEIPCIRVTNNMLCYIQYQIYNNIVHKVSGGIQLRCNITPKQAIKYAITWAHKAWVKMMQLGTSAISVTSTMLLNKRMFQNQR